MVGLILYLSRTPDPAMVRIDWLPASVGAWADRHGTLRTGVALVPPGGLLGLWLAVNRRAIKDWITGGSCLLTLVIVAELGQLVIPRRVFDWRDILWGGAGIICGMGLAALAHFGWSRRRL